MNVFELYASISLDKGDYEKGLDKAGKKTSEFSQKLKSGLATAAKIGTAPMQRMPIKQRDYLPTIT